MLSLSSSSPYLPPDWEIAHRCGGLDAPENSVEAVRLAAEHGARWVELDISFSKDGVAVAFHDSRMERLTGLTGDITSFPYSQLAGEDLALKHNSSTQGPVAIPRVEQVLEEAARHGLKVILDLKTWSCPGQTVELVLQLYRDFPWLETRGMVTTFHPHLAFLLRRRRPTIVTAVSVDRRWPQLVELGLWRLLGFSAVLASKELVTEQLRDFWLERGVRLMAWTVNDEQEKRSMKEMRIQILTDTVTVT